MLPMLRVPAGLTEHMEGCWSAAIALRSVAPVAAALPVVRAA